MVEESPGGSTPEQRRNSRRDTLLIEQHATLLTEAAAALEACDSWSLATPMVLLDQRAGGVGRILPIGQLGQWLEHLPPALDDFIRLRKAGMGVEEAWTRCRREGGDDFAVAWERAQQSEAMVCHDDLAQFAGLCQRGSARRPRELLVVVRWPEQVSAFLLSCQRQGQDERQGPALD